MTEVRRHMRRHREKTGEKLSFTAFIITCMAKAVDENKLVHGYRNRKGQVVLFDEVDVSTQIEHEEEGRRWVLPHIVRAANKRTFKEIHQEIRSIQFSELKEAQAMQRYAWYLRLPKPLRRILTRIGRNSPQLWKRTAGTVAMSSLGMFGETGFWGIPIASHTLFITLGGIAERPTIVDGAIEAREYLSITISFDHDIIDGAPAARFAQRMKELIETGYGLLNEKSFD